MADVLSDILDTICLSGVVYFRTDFSPPFAIALPPYGEAARFHLVVQGICVVELPDGQIAELHPGDLILVNRGSAHTLADAAGRAATPLDQVIKTNGYSGTGLFVVGRGDPDKSTQMVCGHLTFARGADHPLLRALPPVVVITAKDRTQFPLLDDVLRLIVKRMAEEAPGAQASVSRLAEILYIEIVRATIDRSGDMQRLFSAVSDPQIGRALALVHERVAEDWTLERLASDVGMSRTRFAQRFHELVGMAPMSYLADWRMQRARALLAEPAASVKDVAHKTGYNSAAAFSRAFSAKFGHPPRSARAE